MYVHSHLTCLFQSLSVQMFLHATVSSSFSPGLPHLSCPSEFPVVSFSSLPQCMMCLLLTWVTHSLWFTHCSWFLIILLWCSILLSDFILINNLKLCSNLCEFSNIVLNGHLKMWDNFGNVFKCLRYSLYWCDKHISVVISCWDEWLVSNSVDVVFF